MSRHVPLRWPADRQRTQNPKPANFSDERTLAQSVRALIDELELVKPPVRDIVVTCADPGRFNDPAAAVWFTHTDDAGRPMPVVLAADRWDRVAHNVWAIAQHVHALRAQSRWGVGTVAQAFAGYAALPASPRAAPYVAPPPPPRPTRPVWTPPVTPAPGPPPPAADRVIVAGPRRTVLGFARKAEPSRETIEQVHTALARRHHPDVPGGSNETMAIINNARDEALAHRDDVERHTRRHTRRQA